MKTNRLINEKSPYLLQHAKNPVDWYPWGKEAFEKARREDKPVFLSIGYSTCHWCHVMERESFENEDVAGLLNETFVNIKVDREERPDIDAVYMTVCRIMTQSGGWPLTIIMTPDQEPLFAATYIPRTTGYGRAGMLQIVPRIKEVWETKRADVLSAASEITGALNQSATGKGNRLPEEVLHQAYRSLSIRFDKTFGGFGRAPKFPLPHHFFFLLRYWKRTGDGNALYMAEHTLQNMRSGGIYDHVGFGFHRYSTDERWVVPHFEKMLYDQALMAMAFIELFQATGKAEYEATVREIFTCVLRDLTDEQGGFYCAEDADSEGVEGKFYLWTEEEIRSILSEKEAGLFLSLYRHPEDGDLPGAHGIPAGCFIPHLMPFAENKKNLGEMLSSTEHIRRKLFAAREKRNHPHKDDKILADWNGLMIAALARGARVLDESVYARAACRAMNFILESMQTRDGKLLHRYRNGEAAIDANVDDYAFVIRALLELYEATFHTPYLQKALEYNEDLFSHFLDHKNGGLFFTSVKAEKLLTRPKELYDGAVPSGNSVAYGNVLKMFRMTGNADMEAKAHAIYKAFEVPAGTMPEAFTQFLCGLEFAVGPSSQVIITGDLEKPDTREMLRVLRKQFVPNNVVIFRPEKPARTDIESIAPFVKTHLPLNGKATAVVCTDSACNLPTNDPQKVLELLHTRK